MKKVLKKIYDVLPNGIKKLYWQTRKKVGQILMFRIVFPLGYKKPIINVLVAPYTVEAILEKK